MIDEGSGGLIIERLPAKTELWGCPRPGIGTVPAMIAAVTDAWRGFWAAKRRRAKKGRVPRSFLPEERPISAGINPLVD